MEGNTEPQKPSEEQINPEDQILEASERDWLKTLRGKLNRVFRRERSVGGRGTTVNIFYSPHRSSEDMDGLADQFQKCDIYFPETFGWSPEYLDTLRKLSNGQVTPKMALQEYADTNPFIYARDKSLFNIIYKSKKPIAFLDIPNSHSLVKLEKENKVPEIHFGSNFVQVLDSVREYIKKAADIQRDRETYMLHQLRPQIQELLKTHQTLREKQELNILISIGIAHTSLYRYLRKDYQTMVKFGKKPMAARYGEEALSKHMFNENLDDDLIVRIVAEWTLSKGHKKLFYTNDSLKDAMRVRGLISRFSFDELKEMFEGAHDSNEWTDMFVQGLKERIKAPAAVK